MEFHEIQTIQCPDRQSFDAHLGIWKDIELELKPLNVEFNWKVLSEEDRTFELNIKGHTQPIIYVFFKALKSCEVV